MDFLIFFDFGLINKIYILMCFILLIGLNTII